MNEGIQARDVVDSKTVEYNVPDRASSYPLLVTALNQENNKVLDSAGYRSRMVIFTMIDGGMCKSFDDPYSYSDPMFGSNLQEFCVAVMRGWQTKGSKGVNWADIEDGGVYTPESLEELTE